MSKPEPATVTLTRRFTHEQAEKRAEALRAAAELASQGGYEAVTMAAVADRIGLSRATVYRYFSSKDHLLAEITREWTLRIDEELRRQPPPGKTLSERVAAAFERIIRTSGKNRGLTAALVIAATSSDPAAIDAFPSWSDSVRVYLRTLAGNGKIKNLEDVVTVLSYVLFSALIAMALRGQDPAESARVLRTTVRLLLDSRR